MAKKHLTRINQITAQLKKVQTDMEALLGDIQDNYDNLSDSRQESEYGEGLEDAINALDCALNDGIYTAIDELQNAASALELIPTVKPKKKINIDVDLSLPLAAGLAYWHHKREERQQEEEEEPTYNPYDNHWGDDFDWIDEDNDGYDDREDGFLE